jgi:hypothetical protein
MFAAARYHDDTGGLQERHACPPCGTKKSLNRNCQSRLWRTSAQLGWPKRTTRCVTGMMSCCSAPARGDAVVTRGSGPSVCACSTDCGENCDKVFRFLDCDRSKIRFVTIPIVSSAHQTRTQVTTNKTRLLAKLLRNASSHPHIPQQGASHSAPASTAPPECLPPFPPPSPSIHFCACREIV